MANTIITLDQQDGKIFPSSDAVSVVQGDTIDIVGANGSDAVLAFSPDAISLLSPNPASPLPLAASAKVSFTFSSSNPGAYSITFSSAAAPEAFPIIPSSASTSLLLQIPLVEAAPPPPMSVAGGRTRDAQG